MEHAESRSKLEASFQSIGAEITKYFRTRLKGNALAEDLTQEVFLRIHKNIDSLKDIRNINAWIYKIARNVLVDHVRSSSVRLTSTNLDDMDLVAENKTHTPEFPLRSMIEQLPEPYREALILTSFDGWKQNELAERQGISLPAAKSRVQRGRQMLKEIMLECCHFEFDRYGTLLHYEAHEKPKCCESRLHSIRGPMKN
jgi:RNA polymerase sigma-70 factor (ECF subfamily)